LRVWWKENANASTGTIGLRSQRTGTMQWLNAASTPDYKTRTAAVTIDAPDIVDVYVKWMSGVGVPYSPTSLAAWWEPASGAQVPGVTFDTTWKAISQAAVYPGRPDSTYVLAWLARKANQLMNDRQRVVLSVGGGAGHMRIAPFVPGLTVWLYVKSSVARTYYINFYDIANPVPFGQSSVLNVPGDNTWAWRSVTFPAGFTAERVVLWSQVKSGPEVTIASIAFEEDQPTAASLGLPVGETIPAAYTDVDDVSLRARIGIWADRDAGGSRAHGRKALVENMIWLWASKVRTLWNENLISPWPVYGGGTVFGNTDPPSNQTQEIVRFRATPDGWTKQLRVAGSSSIGFDGGTGQPYPDTGGQGIATGQWAAENGGAAALKTLTTRVPLQEWPNEWWVEEAPGVAAGAAFIFRTLLMNPPAAGQPVKAFANGLVVEELPYGTAVTAWP
jgi:hypothetical protein